MEGLSKKRKGGEPDLSFSRKKKLNSMEGLSKKRKGGEPDLSFSRKKKRVNGVVYAPKYGMEFQIKGLKRKVGCIDVANQKKNIVHDYHLAKPLGQGKFGSVILCRSKATGEDFACKILKKGGEEIIEKEVEIMKHLSGHPGLVTLKEVYEDSEFFHLVMELCSGGRLLDQMAREKQFSEIKAACIIKNLMLAIRDCHEMGVVHRDIKPENILLTASGEMKLADFGLAERFLDGQSFTGIVGSPGYVAPEVLEGSYSEKVDIWSAGVLLHALLIGVLPFQGDSVDALFEAIKNDKLEFTGGHWKSVSQPARDLISKMLTRNISTRLTANDVLRHPWITFYTEPELKTSTPIPKMNPMRFSSRCLPRNDFSQTSNFSHSIGGGDSGLIGAPKPKRRRICRPSAGEVSGLIGAPELKRSKISRHLGDGEGNGLIDALAVAISRLRISEPERSRISTPSVDGEDTSDIDALVMAISRFRISEIERNRVCSPLSRLDCLSNLNNSKLCTVC